MRMIESDRISRRQLLGGAAATALVSSTGFAAAADSVKMSLEFRIYGGNAPMFMLRQTFC